MQTGSRKQIFNEINITPLTDIFLVLLIIMMVVAPMMQQLRKDIKPPQLNNGAPVEQNKLTVEITKDGAIYVMGKEASKDHLSDVLKEQQELLVSKGSGRSPVSQEAAAEPEEKNLIIRADKTTKSGEVLKVFEAARDAGFTKVTVSGEALSDARQTQLQQAGLGSQAPVEGY
ncbi:MAG TPA: biopolymer transporter ExbD [Oculatellaceae cyanobacterium]|jgi:biopolymer transport protein ExbD